MSQSFPVAKRSVFLVVHGGFDFDPTTYAVCSTEEQAKALRIEHYKNPENEDFPWNGCHIVEVPLDKLFRFTNQQRVGTDIEPLLKESE